MNLALFDLDNTLLAGDSDYSWGQFLIQKGLINAGTHQDLNARFYADYQSGQLDIVAYLNFQLAILTQYPRATLDALHQNYMREVIVAMMTPKAKNLVQQHRLASDLLVIITSTNRFVTAPIAQALGIEHLIASELEEIDGEFTGKIFGIPSFREGKVHRLQAWLAMRGESLGDFAKSYFYTDSHNDLSLLKLVTHPVAVDADAVLAEYAQAHGWSMLTLRD